MIPASDLRVGSGSELPLQASKWLDIQLLIDAEEMKQLFLALGEFKIFRVGAVCRSDEGEISKQDFLASYECYINALKNGKLPHEKDYRPFFSSVITINDDHLFQIPVGNDRRIIRVEKPVLQLQVNKIAYSSADGKFRAMVFGKNSILWGLQVSYPQLYQDALTKEVFTVDESPKFPNTSLFRKLQLWVRRQTIPTPFMVDEKRINVPMRLGKCCLSWINSHPEIISSQFKIIQ